MKFFRTLFLVVAMAMILMTTACLKSKTLIIVNPDGSGNITVSTLMCPDMAAMLKGFSQKKGETSTVIRAKDPLFNEDQFRRGAAQFGSNVQYVKGTKLNEHGWKGFTVVYAFQDINLLQVPMNQAQSDGSMMSTENKSNNLKSAKKQDLIHFQLSGDDIKSLKILMPQSTPNKAKSSQQSGQANGLADKMTESIMESMGKMVKGMELEVAVQVMGQVVKSNATHQEGKNGDRTILTRLDFDKLMAPSNREALSTVSTGLDADHAQALQKLNGLPGVMLETNRQVVIQFK